jgi:hypothetical protein
MVQPLLSVEELAELLCTRVLRPDEFDGIAVSRDTLGWSSVEASHLFSSSDQAQIRAWLNELDAGRQAIAGILPADEQHPIRIVTRLQSKPPRRKQHRPSRTPTRATAHSPNDAYL